MAILKVPVWEGVVVSPDLGGEVWIVEVEAKI